MAADGGALVLPSVEEVDALAAGGIPAFLAHLAALQLRAAARLASNTGEPAEQDAGDVLLGVAEAAKRLGTSEDWLYRHASELPFTRRLSGRQLRFSGRGIEQYIRQRKI